MKTPIVIVALFCLFGSQAMALSKERSVSADDLQRFFEDENHRPKTQSVRVVDAYAKLDFAFGFADGHYALATYKIKKIRPNIYAVGLTLHKKKGIAVYRQDVASFFWYDGGQQIVFKDGDRKKVYDVNRGWHVEKRPTSSGHDLSFRPHTDNINVQLDHPAGKVYLTLSVP